MDITCVGAALGEEELAAKALHTMHYTLFTKRDELAQMDKHSMQEQAISPDGQAQHARAALSLTRPRPS